MNRTWSISNIDPLTEIVIGCAFEVGNELGYGFLEKVNENALFVLLTQRGLRVEQQRPIKVKFRGAVVGDYFADLVVEDLLIVEIKCASGIDDAHVAQCINYLSATGMRYCLIINFGSKVDVRRLGNTRH